MRLFIAINFEDALKNSLCETIERLKGDAVKGSFTHRDNLHLTLVFLGEVAVDKVSLVKAAMNKTNCSPFELKLSGIGRFKHDGGDILWVGVDISESLLSIYNQLSTELTKSGFSIERREYKPHLTLGREVVLKDSINIGEAEVSDMHMTADKISLMKSERIGGLLRYTEIYAKQL